MHSIRDQLNQVRRAALAGILGSSVLSVVKILAGVVGHSYAMIADGVESCGDAVAGLVILLGLSVAEKPPDDEHPYGHSRAEDIAGNTISTMMLVSGILLLWSNVQGLVEDLSGKTPRPIPHVWTIWLILLSLVVKGCLFVYKRNVGARIRSVSLRADAWNDFNDSISAAVVFFGLIFARAGYIWADRAGAIVVSLLIMYTAHAVSRAASAALLDQQAPPEVLRELRETARAVPGVKDVEKLLARRSGLMYFVDLHLEVDGAMPVRDAHALGHVVKSRLQASRPDIAGVLIHLEPAKTQEPRT